MSNYLIGSDVIGADVIAPQRPVAVVPVQQNTKMSPEEKAALIAYLKYGVAPALAASIAGALLWKKHRVLGFLAGGTLGASIYPISKGGDTRTNALLKTAGSAASIGGALMWKNHPILGYLAGGTVFGVVGAVAARSIAPSSFKAFMLRGRTPTAGVT
jgi:hypothetical protein